MSDDITKPFYKKWWFIVLVVIVIAAGVGGEGGSGGTKYASTGGKDFKPNIVVSSRPGDEQKFIEAVEKGQKESKGVENDMARGGILKTRNDSLCASISSVYVNDWTGWVESIDSNSDGKGVLSVEVTRNATVETWNNDLSDIGSNTLLEPGSELFTTASALKEGQEVKFSGHFITERKSCIGEQSMGLRGKLEDPEFTFKFSSIEKL